MFFKLKPKINKISNLKNNYDEKFYFKCAECNHIFFSKIGTPCPNCGSINVRIITTSKLLKFFTG